MTKYLDKLMEYLAPVGHALTKLGGGAQWKVGNVTVKLWPFVAFAIIVALIAGYDIFIRP